MYASYVDKRPYESAYSDPFYAAALGLQKPFDRQLTDAYLMVRAQTGLYEKDLGHGSIEFTLPTHESVISAWIERTRDRNAIPTACDPSGAFFVDGLHGIADTKQYLKREKTGRFAIDLLTHVNIEFFLKFRLPGRRPAGTPIALPTTCNEPDRIAALRDPFPTSGALVPETAAMPPVVVDVSRRGTVMNVDVKQSVGSRSQDEAMLAAAKGASFIAARWKCLAVPDRILVPEVMLDQSSN